MKPSEVLLKKALIASDLNTERWSSIQAGLRNRAFFSSQVTSAKILYTMRQVVGKISDGGMSPSEFRRDLRQYLDSVGYAPKEEDAGTIKDLYSKQRLDVIIKTNVDQAKGYVRFLRDTREGAILAFPAYRFVRRQNRKTQRDWATRWANAAKAVNFEGVAKNGEMIALKYSPIWAKLSRFGTPFPPFDFNSGMGLEDVKKSYCREIGLLGENEQPKVPKVPDFNGKLSQPVPFDNKSPEYAELKRHFKDQIQFNRETHEVEWRSEIFADMFEPGHKFTFKLGEASNALIDKLPKSIPANAVQGKHLTINERWLDKKRKDKATDHRIHFEEMEDHPEDIPLKKGDVDMLPSVWREPDRVFEDKGSLILEVDAIDGGIFRAVVKPSNSPTLKTFYRTTESWEDYLKKRMARHK